MVKAVVKSKAAAAPRTKTVTYDVAEQLRTPEEMAEIVVLRPLEPRQPAFGADPHVGKVEGVPDRRRIPRIEGGEVAVDGGEGGLFSLCVRHEKRSP